MSGSTQTAAKQQAANDPAASKTKVRFGIILQLGGTNVPVTTGDIADAKKNGVEFTLQQPVTLPDFNAFETWVSDHFQVTIPSADSLPPPLNTVVQKLEGLVVSIETFHIKIPPSGDGKKVQLTVEANATFGGEPVTLIDGALGIQGFVFGFSNEPVPKPTPAGNP